MKRCVFTTLNFFLFFGGWAVLVSVLPLPHSNDPAIWRLWAEIIPLLCVAVFTLLFWLAEKRTVELHLWRAPVRNILLGAVAGVAWLGSVVGVLVLAGVIGFVGSNTVSMLGVWFVAALANVIMQELLVRGYLYQRLKQNHNAIAAVLVTTALFTVLHGGALAAGVIPVLNVVTMSLLMTAVLEYTGTIIAPVMMHFIWNGIGALILGGVSLAEDYPKLLNMTFTGREWLSGGVCKIEGSVIVLIMNVLLIVQIINRRSKAAA